MPTPVGSSAVVDTSANSGTQAITVPTCTFALLQWFGLGSGTNLMTSMSLDGVAGIEIIQTPGVNGSFGCGVYYVKSPAAGSKNLAWDFNGATGFSEGGQMVVSFFTGVELTGDPHRDAGVDAQDGTDNLTDTLTTITSDYVHIGVISYDVYATTAITGQTTDQDVTPYDHGYVRIAHVNSPGASTTACAANGAFYGAALFVALKNSGGGGSISLKRNAILNGLGASGPFFNNPLG